MKTAGIKLLRIRPIHSILIAGTISVPMVPDTIMAVYRMMNGTVHRSDFPETQQAMVIAYGHLRTHTTTRITVRWLN